METELFPQTNFPLPAVSKAPPSGLTRVEPKQRSQRHTQEIGNDT